MPKALTTLAALIALAAFTCAARAATVPISISGSSFGSANAPVTVNVGDTVVWTNNDAMAHTVTSGVNGVADGKFGSGNLDQGQVYSHTFAATGSFPYFCEYHGTMVSTIVVQRTVTIDVKGFAFGNNNAPVTITQGDTVVWRNLDAAVTHTITTGVPGTPDGMLDKAFLGNASNPPTISLTFTKAGTFPYYCRPHQTHMKSSIVVNPLVVRGDVNGDGVVDMQDVIAALGILGGRQALATGALANVDVAPTGGDGAFDLRDGTRILRFVSGLDSTPL